MSAVTKDKLIEDLKVVANDVEELLRATANQTGSTSEARGPLGVSVSTNDTRVPSRSSIGSATSEA